VALERGVTENQDPTSEPVVQARKYLQTAQDICKRHPGQTKGMWEEVEDVLRMLRESTFYATVTNEEKAAVYAAMANELRGTGHWYYCVYGHPFTVGECGMPMQTSVCPQCGSPVGGQSHQSVEGVTRAADMDAQFANMRI
jgi:transcription initiation factor IIE alpha subunit